MQHPVTQFVPAVDFSKLAHVDNSTNTDFYETEGLHQIGNLFPIRLSNSQWHTDEEKFRTLIIRDITARKDMQMALSDEKERLNVTLRSIGDAVITTTTSGEIVLMNQIAEQLTGWSEAEAAGRQLGEVFHCLTRMAKVKRINPVSEVMEKRTALKLTNNLTLIAKDGTERIVTESCAPIRDHTCKIRGAVLVFSDITDQKKFESELLKASKLESIGILAGGIAHD
ncbi:PAS domain S-box protein, partial [bacterium]|nr:PAS domain S-box protein [bacterium]